MLIWNRLKAHAALRGEKLALVCGDTRLTYAQLVARAENVARAWLLQGLRPGDRIAASEKWQRVGYLLLRLLRGGLCGCPDQQPPDA